MTPFALLCQLAGLSHREAAELLGVRVDTAKSWSAGRNRCPDGGLAELRVLIAAQERAAREALAIVRRGKPEQIELGYPTDDHEAQSLGWPCVGAWSAMAARIVVGCRRTVILVPRGATPTTAAAAYAREGGSRTES